jgi:hypothetical protein
VKFVVFVFSGPILKGPSSEDQKKSPCKKNNDGARSEIQGNTCGKMDALVLFTLCMFILQIPTVVYLRESYKYRVCGLSLVRNRY